MITLEGPGISVTLLPERGGKITSLLDTASGREWLEAPEGALSGIADATVEYDDGDMCGWDEMMPTLSACEYPGTSLALPDHGELWSKSWDVTSLNATSVTTSVRGGALPYQFERTLRVGPRSLRVDYRVSTDSGRSLQLLWAAHPLFAVSAGTRLILEASKFESSLNDVSVADDLAVGTSIKLFARLRAATSTAKLLDASGTFLTLTWNRGDAPHVGLWLDHMQYARHPVTGIEPTNCPFESLSEAIGANQAWTVSRSQPRRWSMEVELGSTEHTPLPDQVRQSR
jgi:hypothetical protein